MGVPTSYLEAGPRDAPPVVMLHGLGATNASLLPCLADLARDHRVIAPDLPGFGNSAAPRVAYTPAWFAAWVEDLMRQVDARPAVVLGNSLGGRIAIEAGLAHPRSVRGLVLLTPSPAFRRLRQVVPMVKLLRPELARLPLPVNHRLVVEVVRQFFGEPDRLPRPWYDAAADECVRVLRSSAHREALLSCARQIVLEEAHGRHGFWDRLPTLQPPADDALEDLGLAAHHQGRGEGRAPAHAAATAVELDGPLAVPGVEDDRRDPVLQRAAVQRPPQPAGQEHVEIGTRA
jgi:pimeloyl-ACP methyl ester carboxylesterase